MIIPPPKKKQYVSYVFPKWRISGIIVCIQGSLSLLITIWSSQSKHGNYKLWVCMWAFLEAQVANTILKLQKDYPKTKCIMQAAFFFLWLTSASIACIQKYWACLSQG